MLALSASNKIVDTPTSMKFFVHTRETARGTTQEPGQRNTNHKKKNKMFWPMKQKSKIAEMNALGELKLKEKKKNAFAIESVI